MQKIRLDQTTVHKITHTSRYTYMYSKKGQQYHLKVTYKKKLLFPSSTGFSRGSKEKIPLGSSFAWIITVATPALKMTVSPKKRVINFIKTGIRNGANSKIECIFFSHQQLSCKERNKQ